MGGQIRHNDLSRQSDSGFMGCFQCSTMSSNGETHQPMQGVQFMSISYRIAGSIGLCLVTSHHTQCCVSRLIPYGRMEDSAAGTSLGKFKLPRRMLTSRRRGGRMLPATATEPISQKYRLKKTCREKFGNSLMMRYLQA